VVFGSLTTGVGLADDLQKGLIERFRSLPMARSAVLVGRTLADLVRNVFVVVLMAAVGFIVGWKVHTNVLALLAGLLLVVAFAYSLSWLFAIIGMSAPNGETAQAASFPLLAPLVFASSAFVPLKSMPGWLQAFASRQPVSIVVNAVRALTLGGATRTYLIQALAWIVAIVAVCAPLAVAKYRRSV
jgi:ABC transporter DrrB family efflux protein